MAETKSAVEDEVILPRPFKLRLEANAAAGKKVRSLQTRRNRDWIHSEVAFTPAFHTGIATESPNAPHSQTGVLLLHPLMPPSPPTPSHIQAKTLITREEHAPYISYGLHVRTLVWPAFSIVST